MTRKKRIRTAVLVLSLLGALLIILDSLQILAVRPPPGRLLAGMSTAWERLEGYQADVSVGSARSLRGRPQTCRQWYQKDGDLVVAATDHFGLVHIERWRADRWSYFQPGPAFEAEISVSNLDRLPYARWIVAGYPTLEDLVRVVRDLRDIRVVRSVPASKERLWVVAGAPGWPDPGGAGRLAAEFYREHFSRPWQVWLSDRTGLPVHVRIGTDQDAIRIGVEQLATGPLTLPADWRGVAGVNTSVRRRFQLWCDSAASPSLQAVRDRLQAEIATWRRTIYPRDWDAASQKLDN